MENMSSDINNKTANICASAYSLHSIATELETLAYAMRAQFEEQYFSLLAVARSLLSKDSKRRDSAGSIMSCWMNLDEGVQVVRLEDGEKRYVLDVEALKRVLLRADVRNLPVMVVSVAGAYRGGKSFILDFFLRYINAPRASQLSGEWLGNEDDPLKGFHWRGGGERDTAGIHLWPQPIITTLGATGEKVAVLLMDTQGTFDSECTLGQNSTIFALSTLISSVQIYNLSGNIKEDDLQHLQLFTEYSKLACGGNRKAFQKLIFLVRDWMSDYEHAHGFGGGYGLLKRRLRMKPNQKAELREVREHICSCFDQIKCFLAPHPGLNVVNQNFTGCLCDLTDKFRLALLELVPSIFDPEHITPKFINGERIRTQDLLEYFQKYVDIFNSDEVPEAVTIFNATADASMTAAVRESRELYEAHMAERVRDGRSMPARALAAWHDAARLLALQQYETKRKIGSPANVHAHLEKLKKELDGRLSVIMWNNDAKVRHTMSLAKKAYEAAVSKVSKEHARLCLHTEDLQELHAKAMQAALTEFDSARDMPENEEDDKRPELVRSLEELYEHLRAINDKNNKSAVMEARNQYVTHMKLKMDQSGISSDLLQEQHKRALADATAHFAKLRNRSTKRNNDPYVQQLHQEISHYWAEFKMANTNNKKTSMQAAEHMYNNHMASAWGPQGRSLNPQTLEDMHRRAVGAVHQEFHLDAKSGGDNYTAALDKKLRNRFTELQSINESKKQQEVKQSLNVQMGYPQMGMHNQRGLLCRIIGFISLLASYIPILCSKVPVIIEYINKLFAFFNYIVTQLNKIGQLYSSWQPYLYNSLQPFLSMSWQPHAPWQPHAQSSLVLILIASFIITIIIWFVRTFLFDGFLFFIFLTVFLFILYVFRKN